MNIMNVPPHVQPHHQDTFSPLDTIPPHDGLVPHQPDMFQQTMLQLQTNAEFVPQSMSLEPGLQSQHPSQPSTTYSGSPSPVDPGLLPQPQQVTTAGPLPDANMWNGYNVTKVTAYGSGMDGMDIAFNHVSYNNNFEMQQLGDRLNSHSMAFNAGFEYNEMLPRQL